MEAPELQHPKYQLVYEARAVDDLAALPREARKTIDDAVEEHARFGTGSLERLTAVKPPTWRMRVGDFRVLLTFESMDVGAPKMAVQRVLRRNERTY